MRDEPETPTTSPPGVVRRRRAAIAATAAGLVVLSACATTARESARDGAAVNRTVATATSRPTTRHLTTAHARTARPTRARTRPPAPHRTRRPSRSARPKRSHTKPHPTRPRATRRTPVTTHAATTKPATTHPAPPSHRATTTASSTAPATSPSTSPTTGATARSGAVVVLDPGHNGGNADHPSIVNALVPAGNGQMKPCNSVGTAADDGYPEHAFNWSVAVQVRGILEQAGVRVIMTRPDDYGVGPCVNVRAEIGNDAHADAVVSIHGDGSVAGHGFHIIRSPIQEGGPTIAEDGRQLASDVRGSMLAHSGLTTATYVNGGTGYNMRTDLAGLNLSTRPSILIECGNMRDSGDAAIMESESGRARIAEAIAAGILTYLGR